MKKRYFCIAAALALCFVLIPCSIQAAGSNEAKIGGTEYATLGEAVAEANASGSDVVIEVLKDITVNAPIDIDPTSSSASITIKSAEGDEDEDEDKSDSRRYTVKAGPDNSNCIFSVLKGRLVINNIIIDGSKDKRTAKAAMIDIKDQDAGFDMGAKAVLRNNNYHAVKNCGTFNMNGGTISNNSAGNGGGVYVDQNGTFNMNGGTISENRAVNGGGVYIASGKMNVSGNAKVQNNKNTNGSTADANGSNADNIYLASGMTINITGPVRGAYFGITAKDIPAKGAPVAFAQGWKETHGDLKGIFISDKGYSVTHDGNGNLQMSVHPAPIKGSGYSIDYLNETLSLSEGYVANEKNDLSGKEIVNGGSIKDHIGKKIYICMKNTLVGEVAEAEIPARPGKPALTAVNESVSGRRDGKIQGFSEEKTYEYKLCESYDDWTTITGKSEITWLIPGEYAVRLKADNTEGSEAFAGEIAYVTIDTGEANTYILSVTAPVFSDITAGDPQPEGQNIIIENTGNSDATIKSVTVSSEDFLITGADKTVPSGGKLESYKICPAEGLAPGTHKATIKVIYNNDASAEAEVSITVKKKASPAKNNTSATIKNISQAKPGDTVSMRLSANNPVVDKKILKEAAGKDIVLRFTTGDVSWYISGEDIPEDADPEALDLGIKTGESNIPGTLTGALSGSREILELSLDHDGPFAIPLRLEIGLGEDNKGNMANLYHYITEKKRMSFEHSAKIGEDGNAIIPFDHASDYVIVIDGRDHSNAFSDVNENDWFSQDVALCHAMDIMNGIGENDFKPYLKTTRGMLVTTLWRMERKPSAEHEITFEDVEEGSYYEEAVRWASGNDIVNGYSSISFAPDDSVTREQLAKILFNYAKYKGKDVSVGENTNILSYNDAFTVSEWAIPSVQWTCGTGIIAGDRGNLMPQKGANRAEMAAMLVRFLSV